MNTIKIETKHSFTPEEINDLMVCALEGGINYWCGYVEIIEIPEKHKDKINYASDVIGYDGKLKLFDCDTDDVWVLDKPKFLKGIKLYCENFNYNPNDIMEDHDIEMVDLILQLAIFEEIIFG